MVMSVLPTSIEIDTGMSRITSRFGPSRLTGALERGTLPNSSICARGAGGVALCESMASMSSWSASPASASAAAHSSASAFSSEEVS